METTTEVRGLTVVVAVAMEAAGIAAEEMAGVGAETADQIAEAGEGF